MSRDLAIALRQALSDPVSLCARLDLLAGAERQGRNVSIRCPAHGDDRPSCSVHVAPDRTVLARCHACGWSADALGLIALVRDIEPSTSFRRLLGVAAELAGVSLAEPPVVRPVAPRAERTPPPAGEVREMLAEEGLDGETAAWLESRRLDPWRCGRFVRVLGWKIPRWAGRRGHRGEVVSWDVSGHRLILPTWDAEGRLRSVRARLVRAVDEPKSLPPAGYRTAGLVLATPIARAALRSGFQGSPAALVVAEGEPDYLTWASRLGGRWGVIGLPGSGAWTSELAHRIPRGSLVVVRTDPDPAGDDYAATIAEQLAGRAQVIVSDPIGRLERALCGCRRCVGRLASRKPECERTSRGKDDNALAMAGELPADPREGTAEVRRAGA